MMRKWYQLFYKTNPNPPRAIATKPPAISSPAAPLPVALLEVGEVVDAPVSEAKPVWIEVSLDDPVVVALAALVVAGAVPRVVVEP